MKTAISIPDNIFIRADNLANVLKVSRSQLFTMAISEFIEEHNNEDITRKLNEIYGEEDSSVDSEIYSLQFNTLNNKDKW